MLPGPVGLATGPSGFRSVRRGPEGGWRIRPPAATPGDPEWLTALPEELDSDVVVVAKGEGVQFVACAITSIAADTVTVSLDGEAIPVKRDRVVGMRVLGTIRA